MTGLIIDSFAGGGGASTGIEWALGRAPDFAINHDPEALAMHEANHPETIHLTENIWRVNPQAVTRGKPVDLLWASPDCRHHSRAKGGAPVSRSTRGLAHVVVLWAQQVAPRVIFLENVEEFAEWGPLDESNKPCPHRRGQEFRAWVRALEAEGYAVEWQTLRACDFGAPTIRKRLFLVARRDSKPILWPAPTHGDPKSEAVRSGALKPWRTAAEIIDWAIPCPSIFLTRQQAKDEGLKVVRPLADKTLARIARGFKRYVLDRPEPFIVSIAHGDSGGRREYPLSEPHRTVTTGANEHAVVVPYLAQHNGGVLGRAADAPAGTVTTSGAQMQPVFGYLASLQNNTRRGAMDAPAGTALAGGCHHALITAPFMTAYYGTGEGAGCDDPLRTATTRDRFALVDVAAHAPPFDEFKAIMAREVAAFLRAQGVWDANADGSREFVQVGPFIVYDIGMRMLSARELARAQGFPESYILAAPLEGGGTLTDTAQRHKIGNSVSPYPAAALVHANMVEAVTLPEVKPRKHRFPPDYVPPQVTTIPMQFEAETHG